MNNSYVLLTDDSCDMTAEYLKEHKVDIIQLSFSIDGAQYRGTEMSASEFYAKVREGVMPATAQVNVEEACDFFEPYLKSGLDICFLAFSSGLSGTCNSIMTAAKEMEGHYPDRSVAVVDSLCASMGQGLLLHKAVMRRNMGASLQELEEYLLEIRHNVCHCFTVDDLMHLHRGGRVSKASAIAGSLLGIKPMLYVNEAGKLETIDKVRGRKAALNALVDRMEKCVGVEQNDIFMVSHGDCLEDAQYVADLASKRFGVEEYMINYVGPVIGSHSGPGTVALFLMAEKR